MATRSFSRFPRLQRSVVVTATLAVMMGASTLGVLADGGSYDGGQELAPSGDGAAITFEYSSYTAEYDGSLYQYASGDDGTAYYNTYDGTTWSGWQAWDAQPAQFSYDPAPASYGDDSYVYYTGQDGKVYQYAWGEEAWTPIAGDYTFKSAPAASVNNALNLYASADDGYVYHNAYDGSAWSGWAPVNETASYAKAECDPYAVHWGDYENTFWTGDDGKVYWNRYDGSAWTGATAIPGDATFAYGTYAVGYAPEESLYTYGVTEDGKAAYNVFDGEAWAGWEQYDVTWDAKGQPNAYVYEDVQHVVYTGADGHGYHNTYDGTAWGTWEDLGENYGWDSAQYEYDGNLYLTYTGEDGSVYYKTWEPEEETGY